MIRREWWVFLHIVDQRFRDDVDIVGGRYSDEEILEFVVDSDCLIANERPRSGRPNDGIDIVDIGV